MSDRLTETTAHAAAPAMRAGEARLAARQMADLEAAHWKRLGIPPEGDQPVTRPSTADRVNADGSRTITTQRACNGCGELLGDITEHEMLAAIAGRPLPDVRRECPTCGPTAPEPVCRPMTVLAGDALCVEAECDHERDTRDEDRYCDGVREETVCAAHSRTAMHGSFEEITHPAPWPCTANAQTTAKETGRG